MSKNYTKKIKNVPALEDFPALNKHPNVEKTLTWQERHQDRIRPTMGPLNTMTKGKMVFARRSERWHLATFCRKVPGDRTVVEFTHYGGKKKTLVKLADRNVQPADGPMTAYEGAEHERRKELELLANHSTVLWVWLTKSWRLARLVSRQGAKLCLDLNLTAKGPRSIVLAAADDVELPDPIRQNLKVDLEMAAKSQNARGLAVPRSIRLPKNTPIFAKQPRTQDWEDARYLRANPDGSHYVEYMRTKRRGCVQKITSIRLTRASREAFLRALVVKADPNQGHEENDMEDENESTCSTYEAALIELPPLPEGLRIERQKTLSNWESPEVSHHEEEEYDEATPPAHEQAALGYQPQLPAQQLTPGHSSGPSSVATPMTLASDSVSELTYDHCMSAPAHGYAQQTVQPNYVQQPQYQMVQAVPQMIPQYTMQPVQVFNPQMQQAMVVYQTVPNPMMQTGYFWGNPTPIPMAAPPMPAQTAQPQPVAAAPQIRLPGGGLMPPTTPVMVAPNGVWMYNNGLWLPAMMEDGSVQLRPYLPEGSPAEEADSENKDADLAPSLTSQPDE